MQKIMKRGVFRQRLCVVCLSGLLACAAFENFGLAVPLYKLAEEAKYGTCDGPARQDGEKCDGILGNCTPNPLGECVNIGPHKCPSGAPDVLSGRTTVVRSWGVCKDMGNKDDKCDKCTHFYCAKANLYVERDCAGDGGAACTVAVGKRDLCDPTKVIP